MTALNKKIEKFSTVFSNYTNSIRSLFNILGLEIPVSLFDKNRINFNYISYKNIINKNLYDNWLHRHVYIDIIELTREIIVLIIANIFSFEKDFENKKKNSTFKNKKLKYIKIKDILELYQIEEKYKNFAKLFEQYQKIRNCLTHRCGNITEIDDPPLYIDYYKLNYEIFEGKEIKSSTDKVEEILYFEDQNNDKIDSLFLIVTPRIIKQKFSENEKIIISGECIFGVTLFVFVNLKNIFTDLLSNEIININDILEKNDPFRLNFKNIKYNI